MAELTHKLIRTIKWVEIINHYDEDPNLYNGFRYADPNAIGLDEQPRFEDDLFLDFATSRLVVHPYGDVVTSQPTSFTAGYWRVNIENDEGQTIRLYYLPERSYEPDALVQHVGDYQHNDMIHLEHSGYYILAGTTNEMYSAIPDGLRLYWNEVTTEEVEHITTNETIIEEPIGFDGLQTTIKRHEYHGIGAEMSIGNLEFYGNAMDVIEAAYSDDIDSDVQYIVLAGNDVIYQGKLDLSTYSELLGDYRSISVKVGEIGAKTTFNNRTDKEIDVDSPKTIDGAEVETPTWRNLHIPIKHLLYTNRLRQKNTETYTGDGQVLAENTRNQYLIFGVNQEQANEFGSVNTDFRAISDVFGFGDDVSSFYIDGLEDFRAKFGTGTEWAASWDLSLDFAFLQAAIDSDNYRGSYNFSVSLHVYIFDREYGTIIHSASSGSVLYDIRTDVGVYKNLRLQGGWKGTDRYAIALCLTIYNGNGTSASDTKNYASQVGIKIYKGSKLAMKMYDTLVEDDPVYADCILVHDALNVVSHAISENELDVKSDWYRSLESFWNPGDIGGGACKALTNGYKIRGLFTDGEDKRNMPLSFKSLIESLSAMDCIGWGFSTEEGATCVRVERWDWFYKDVVILTLENIAEMRVDIETDRIPTELSIGYKKYATQDQYNSIDSPHGKRTFINGIKAISKSITKESEFIADNYAIEETRRARLYKNETEETSYDESIFVFELLRMANQGGTDYEIGHTAINGINLGRAYEFINAKLTPRHMAARWRDYIFATNNNTPFRFTSGEINYKSSFECVPTSYTEDGTYYNSLESMAIESPQVENADITHTQAKFKAEKISFQYPLTIAQYKTVKANPYGLVSVNGKLGWIMDFKYSFQDGMADFTLIAKYTN